MDAVSYPQPSVIDFISNNLIPLRIAADHKELAPRFRVKWTPVLLLLDASGAEVYRTLGFFSPEELIASLLLGIGKSNFDKAERSAAIKKFDLILKEYPQSGSTPEAVYLQGVANYIETKDVSHLKELYQTLKRDYPQSTWLMRASPYSLL
ncbi:MAG: hypothetical protein RBR43_09125 [Desulfuromonadaceae bacterium]|nr:hypothetical protein [Desulfuromonas sp.]MDY0186026.1 hypothetical protein [Desulfuromonadaceae bacterium]